MLLAGKVAIVTGAAQGIGQACAVRLAKEGAKVACATSSDEGRAACARKALKAKGGEAKLRRCDVSKAGRRGERALPPALKRLSAGSTCW